MKLENADINLQLEHGEIAVLDQVGSVEQFRGCVWLVQDVQSKELWPALAGEMVREYGLLPVVPVSTRQDGGEYSRLFGAGRPRAIVQLPNLYDYIVRGGNRACVDSNVYASARYLEETYEFSIWRDMVLADRHLGRGFTTGARSFPKSKVSEVANPRLMIEACVRSWSYWRTLAKLFPPSLVLTYTSGGGILSFPCARLVQSVGIPFRNISYTRFNDRFYWAESIDAFQPQFAEHFARTSRAGLSEIVRVSKSVGPQILTGETQVAALRNGQTWLGIARSMSYRVAHDLYGRLRRFDRMRYGYTLRSDLASYVRRRTHSDYFNRTAQRSLEEVKGRKIVYLALQTEPEATTYVFGRYASDQINFIRECALSLPTAAVLLVKEHPWQVGMRDRRFYEEVLMLPNVILMHPDYPSLDLIRRSVAVCTTTGSVAYQAAALGIWTFHCQSRSLLDVLPYAVRVLSRSDYCRLREAVFDDDAVARETREELGARFYIAMESFGFPTAPHGILQRRNSYSDAEIKAIMSELKSTLRQFPPVTVEAVSESRSHNKIRIENQP